MICTSDAFLPHAPWQTLDFEEFCALVKEREVGSHSTYALEQRFKALDANDSGRIEMHEYLMFSLRDALARSITRVIELLQSWDSDKSGDISKNRARLRTLAADPREAEERGGGGARRGLRREQRAYQLLGRPVPRRGPPTHCVSGISTGTRLVLGFEGPRSAHSDTAPQRGSAKPHSWAQMRASSTASDALT